jgi:hypothetical protein
MDTTQTRFRENTKPPRLTDAEKRALHASRVNHKAHVAYQKAMLRATRDNIRFDGARPSVSRREPVRGVYRRPTASELRSRRFDPFDGRFTRLRPNFWLSFFESLGVLNGLTVKQARKYAKQTWKQIKIDRADPPV